MNIETNRNIETMETTKLTLANFPNTTQEIQDIIQILLDNNFRVLVPNIATSSKDKIDYFYYSDGEKIAYCQSNRFGYASLSTVNIPNRQCGTGFRVSEDKPVTINELYNTLHMIAPIWASVADAKAVVKHMSLDHFMTSSLTKTFIEIIK